MTIKQGPVPAFYTVIRFEMEYLPVVAVGRQDVQSREFEAV